MEDKGNTSPRHTKRAHLYSDDDNGQQHLPMQDSGSVYTTFAAPSKKSKKSRHKTAWDAMPAESCFYVPLCIDVPDTGIDQEFTESAPLEYSVNKVETLLDTNDACFKN